MTFPIYFHILGHRVHAHQAMEVLAYAGGFQLYAVLRKRFPRADLPAEQRLWILVGALAGAFVGSKLLAWAESFHAYWPHRDDPMLLMSGKTIVGGLAGGWVGVAVAKHLQGVRHHTGDAFVLPLCLGMAVGRVGCFLTGLDDHTYGVASALPWAVDFGDGVRRHPTQLYDIAFLALLAAAIAIRARRPYPNGHLFRLFALSYFGWRFCVEFLKPRETYWGLSPIQMTCVVMASVAALAVAGGERGRFRRDDILAGVVTVTGELGTEKR